MEKDASTEVKEIIVDGIETPKDCLWHILPNGTIRCSNMFTGEVVMEAQDGCALIDKRVEKPVKEPVSLPRVWTYSRSYGQMICDFIAEGKTLTKLSKMPGMPSLGTLARWRAENPDFNEAYLMAKKMRAEANNDKILESIEEDAEIDKDFVPAARLKLDKLKHVTAVDNPEEFGNRTKISGDKAAPLQLIVDTGIDRRYEKEIEDEQIKE